MQPEVKRQFEELQRVLEVVADQFTYWAGPWNGGCYPQGAIVTYEGYTMIALRDTCDPPTPVALGDPFYVYDGASPTGSLLAKSLTVGNDYTFTRAGFLNGYRVYTVTGNVYSVASKVNGAVNQIATFTADQTGWIEQAFTTPVVVAAGEQFSLFVTVQEPDPTPVTIQGNWDYDTPNNPAVPDAGEVTHANQLTQELRVSVTDNDGLNRAAELAQLTIGDVIEALGVRWSISQIVDNTSYLAFTVAPAVQAAPDGVTEFIFETVAATPITTVIDPDFYAGSEAVQPFYEIDADGIVQTDDGYGIDVLVQELDQSEDWGFISVPSGGSGGGDEPPAEPKFEVSYGPAAEPTTSYEINFETNSLRCWGIATGANSGDRAIVFPKAFLRTPTITATCKTGSGNTRNAQAQSSSPTGFTARVRDQNGDAQNVPVAWHAIGEWNGA